MITPILLPTTLKQALLLPDPVYVSGVSVYKQNMHSPVPSKLYYFYYLLLSKSNMYITCLDPEGIWIYFFIYLKRFICLFSHRGEGKEKKRERNINVWLPLMRPLLGTWPATQACALTGSRSSNPLILRPALNPLSHASQGSIWIYDARFSLSFKVLPKSSFQTSPVALMSMVLLYLQYSDCKNKNKKMEQRE